MSIVIQESDLGPIKPKFPQKLYALLESEDVHHAVTWLPDGRHFKIIDEKAFIEVVAPKFFKQTKIRSFHRQLQLWGFTRVSKGVDVGAWHHKLFVRGHPSKVRQIERKNTKKTAAASANAFDSFSPHLLGLSPKNMLVPQGGMTPSSSTSSSMAMMMMMSNYADAQKSNEYLQVQAMSTSMMPKCPVQYNATPMMMPPLPSTMMPKPSLHGNDNQKNGTIINGTTSVPASTGQLSYDSPQLQKKVKVVSSVSAIVSPGLSSDDESSSIDNSAATTNVKKTKTVDVDDTYPDMPFANDQMLISHESSSSDEEVSPPQDEFASYIDSVLGSR